MKRTQIYLQESQDERLAKRAAAVGTTKSKLIREAIDEYLDDSGKETDRLSRFRAAVAEATGSVRDLPRGRDFVEALRRQDLERQRELDSRSHSGARRS